MGLAVYIGLLHHPVMDKEGKVITAAVTNLDLHDLARLAATYDLAGYFVIQPLALQQKLVKRLMSYWREGFGGQYNSTRKEAFARTTLVSTLEEALTEIQSASGTRPRVVGTTARRYPGQVSYSALRPEMQKSGGSWLVLFGTGWGIEPGWLAKHTDRLLEPVLGAAGYNHLSVRTAAAIIIDRLLGEPGG